MTVFPDERHGGLDEARRGLNLLIYPGNLIGGGRLGKIARSLQASGEFLETLVVGIGTPREGLPATEEAAAGVCFTRVAIAAADSRIGRLIARRGWPRRVVRRYAKRSVAVVSAQRASVLPLAYRLSKKTGAVFAYNAHELETEVLGFSGWKQRVAKFVERRYIKHVDVMSVVNESIADWYQNEYPQIERPVVLTNTPIDNGETVDLRAKLGIPDGELLYIHVGNITVGRNVALMLREFAQAPHAHVVFLGDGGLRAQVEEASSKYPNIHWHPMVDPDEVVSYARGADIGLCLIEYASLSDELSTPNKLLESWVAGIPPLSSGLQEAKRLLGQELTETWVLEDPETELASALRRITADDVAAFKSRWAPVPAWETQAVELVKAYREAVQVKHKRTDG